MPGKPLIPSDSRWRLLALENPAETVDWRRVVLLERFDAQEPGLPRVWCESIVEGETWTPVRVVLEGDRLEMDFPSTDFQGMAVRMFLECPKQRVLGSRWRLLDANGTDVTAELVLKRNELITGTDVLRIENFYRTGRPRLPSERRAPPEKHQAESSVATPPYTPKAPSRRSPAVQPKRPVNTKSRALSKSQIVQAIVDAHGGSISHKHVKMILDSLVALGQKELRRTGVFVLPGFARFVVSRG